jgi:hypothetical protein
VNGLMKTSRSIAMALCAIAIAACEKNAVQDITGSLPGSQIKFFNFAINAPNVNFYANDTKMTGLISATGTESVSGTAFGGVGSNGLYSAIAPGQYTLTGRITATVDKDLVIATAPATLADGKAYSFYTSGIYDPVTKKSDAFVVEDPLTDSFDYTVAYVRFVNASHNSSPMTLYVKGVAPNTTPETAIGGLVPYKSAGVFTAIPGGLYDLSTRVAGSSTNAFTRTAVTFNVGKIYTISARGDVTVTSTTAANRPFLDNTANR